MIRLDALSTALVVAVATAGCAAATTDESTAEDPSPSARVTVAVDHCFVQPVTFAGERWNVPFGDQFGWGGGLPPDWQGAGEIVRVSADEARYTDDGGATVVLKHVDDPAVRPVDKALCD